jgi:N-acyl homoserine lactone hydrolase
MRRRLLALALGWLALGGMQAPPAAQPAAPVSLWRLDCGEFDFTDYNAFFSDTSEYPAGPKHLVGSCYLVRHGDQYMLWDTGIPAGVVAQPIRTPAIAATLRASLTDQLARLGVRSDQVGIVGISHYHFDHTGQAATFPHARLLIGRGDVELLRRTPSVDEDSARGLAPWLTGGSRLEPLDSDLDVFGDGSVVMLDLPGHTPGHYGLLVRLASGPVLLSGDTWHFAEQVQRHGVPPFNSNRAESLASMDRLERLARNLHARLIIQHEPADVAKLPPFPEAAR